MMCEVWTRTFGPERADGVTPVAGEDAGHFEVGADIESGLVRLGERCEATRQGD